MHKVRGQRDPGLAFPLASARDDAGERRQANRAVAVSAAGLAFTGLAELLLAVLTGVDPQVTGRAEATAGSVAGVIHAHARARWTGRTLRVEIEGWVDPGMTARDADTLGRLVADEISRHLPEAGSFTWTTRAAPPV